jgi:hypothetical protein
MSRITDLPAWRRRSKTRDTVLKTINERFKTGAPEITVHVTPRDVGRQMGVGITRLCSEIEAAGFRVIRSSNPGYLRRAEIVVRPAPTGLAGHRILQLPAEPLSSRYESERSPK